MWQSFKGPAWNLSIEALHPDPASCLVCYLYPRQQDVALNTVEILRPEPISSSMEGEPRVCRVGGGKGRIEMKSSQDQGDVSFTPLRRQNPKCVLTGDNFDSHVSTSIMEDEVLTVDMVVAVSRLIRSQRTIVIRSR